jgi:hypothetical protein
LFTFCSIEGNSGWEDGDGWRKSASIKIVAYSSISYIHLITTYGNSLPIGSHNLTKKHSKYLNNSSLATRALNLHKVAAFLATVGLVVELDAVGVHLLAEVVVQEVARLALAAVGRSIVADAVLVDTHRGVDAGSSLQEIPASASQTGAGVLVVGETEDRGRGAHLRT